MKRLFKTVAVSAISLAMAGVAFAETWKYSHEAKDGDVQDVYAKAFKKVVEDKSGGKIKVRIYTYGQLGKENDIVELASKGTIKFVAVGTGHVGSFVPEATVLNVPYMLNMDGRQMYKFFTENKHFSKELAKHFSRVNLKLLSVVNEGDMCWGSNKPLTKLEDFKGFKIRTFTSTMPVKSYENFGASATPISWGEVYSALQLKTIDGMYNPIYFIYSTKWYEVQEYLTYPQMQAYLSTVSVNEKWYNNLSDEKKAIIAEAKKAGAKAADEYQVYFNRTAIEKIKEKKPSLKFVYLTQEQIAPFAKRAENMREIFYDVVAESYPADQQQNARKNAEKLVQVLESEAKEFRKF